MSEDRFTIPGLEGRLVLTFVSSIGAAACFAEVDDGGDILLVCVRGRELERERALVGLGIAGPKNKVAELVSLFIGARTGASACISCVYEVCDFELV
jgi:hypothetical protein